MSETESGLPALIEQRRQKLLRLTSDGSVAYPNARRPDTSIYDFVLAYRGQPLVKKVATGPDESGPTATQAGSEAAAPATHRLAGRVMAINNFGKAAFIRIQDDTSDRVASAAPKSPTAHVAEHGEPQRGLLQMYVRQENLSERGRRVRAELDMGDIVYCEGSAMRTKTGELTLLVHELELVTKALRPLPEKWHGLSDVEIRYRQRYLDLIVNPEVRALFRLRAEVTAWLRRYLTERQFLEVETPMMQAQPGGATARPFTTRHQALGIDLYLRIAPELYLKRLVVGGLQRVFELNRNFRNEGISTAHNPEFTMLEFYQAYADVEDMMVHAEQILCGLASEVLGKDEVGSGADTVHFRAPFARMTMQEAIERHGGPTEHELSTAAGRQAAMAAAHLSPGPSAGHDVEALFGHYAERKLIEPTFIYDFPKDISPLARARDGEPEVAERFELYVQGRELANAFSELNDPREQRARFVAQVAQGAVHRGEEAHVDEDYLTALEHGMPPTGGLGLGIDRLMMLLTDAKSIRDVVLFPQMRPER